MIDWFNVEKVKAIAALVQAFGFFLLAVRSHLQVHKKNWKAYKFDIKLQR